MRPGPSTRRTKLSNDFHTAKMAESDQSWKESLEVEDAEKLLNLKESKINEVLESLRSSKEIGQSLEAELVITCSIEDDLFEIWIDAKIN